MTTENMTNGQTWADARSGKARICLHELEPHLQHDGKRYGVYALDGHELLPRTRNFPTLDEARAYANDLWRTL